jgi:D-alanyl-D-alanine carboxypeptidase (penicillin-binding protein 5/6)|tara:strand:+ start:16124 stop:17269 length:1146 start_codon:yes stop_codon:yes gene_type:complete
MIKFLSNLFLILFIFLNSAYAKNQNYFSIPNINVESYALMDVRTGSIVAGKNLDKRVEPASLTKIATLYLVFKSLESKYISEDDLATVSKKAWKMVGSRMFVEVGKKVKVRDLIQGVIVQSGNDASIVLAEHIAGGEEFFVTMLNKLAKDMDLRNTKFKNVTGMPDKDHYTSARDLAILSKKLIEDFPTQYKRFSQKKYTYNSITQRNRNRLLTTYEIADGIKTGHTSTAGYCLSASAEMGSTRFVATLFGANSSKARFKYAKTLLKFGFRNYVTEKHFQKNQIIARERIWNGEDKYIDIGFNKDIYVTSLKHSDKDFKSKINLISKITAPVKINQVLGTIDFIKDNEIVASENIYSLKRVEEGNLYRKVYDYFANFFLEE